MKHILIIASDGPSLINFRLHLIKTFLSKGYKVTVAVPQNKFTYVLQKRLKDLGVKIVFFSLSRTGLNFLKDLRSIYSIYKIILNFEPNLIFSFTAKPVIYTGLVLRFYKNVTFFPLITGVGYGLYKKKSIKHKILKFLMVNLYREGLKSAEKVIFQNKDDKFLFYKLKILKKKNISKIVNGSGVDLIKYPFRSLPKKPVFLMISRLLKDKGVKEYVDAAKIVHLHFPKVIFKLVGGLDENPSSINLKDLQSWIDQGSIKYLGEIESIQSVLKSCKFYVLPSYREGTPRSILEALSTGRPIITTDVPGCRETVIHERNGLLVPVKDSVSLANAMIKLLRESNEKIEKMARESFLIAKNKYEVGKVNKDMLEIMKL